MTGEGKHSDFKLFYDQYLRQNGGESNVKKMGFCSRVVVDKNTAQGLAKAHARHCSTSFLHRAIRHDQDAAPIQLHHCGDAGDERPGHHAWHFTLGR